MNYIGARSLATKISHDFSICKFNLKSKHRRSEIKKKKNRQIQPIKLWINENSFFDFGIPAY